MLEQNHVKKASEIAITAMAFSVWKLALWCLHDISTPKFKISFDRKNCVIDNNAPFRFYTVYPKSLCHMYLLMYVGNTIHISPIFSVCASNFLTDISSMPYVRAFIFSKPVQGCNFFFIPHFFFIKFKDVPQFNLKYGQLNPVLKPI